MNQTTEKTTEDLRAELAQRVAREEAEAARVVQEAREARLRAQQQADARNAADLERELAAAKARFSTSADVEHAKKRTDLIAHLRDLRSRGAHVVNGSATPGQGRGMFGATTSAIDETIERLVAEEKREADKWLQLVAWERAAAVKAAAPDIEPPRDVSSAEDALYLAHGPNATLRIGRYKIRSGAIITPEIWDEIGEQLAATVEGMAAARAKNPVPSPYGAWLIRRAATAGLASVAAACALSATQVAGEVKDAPRLSYAWLQLGDREPALEKAVEIHDRVNGGRHHLEAFWASLDGAVKVSA